MLFIKLLFYALSPFLSILIILLSPILNLRLCPLSSERIGEFTNELETYFKKKKIIKKNLDIFFTPNFISNKFYLYLVKKKIIIVNGFIVFPIYKIFFKLSKFINYFDKFLIDISFDKQVLSQININFSEGEPIIELPKEYLDKGESFLKKIGISNSDKIILLYVRDSSYLKKTFPNKDFSYHDFRDSDVENYVEAINYATSKGYYVFRMGAIVEKSLNLENKKFIDYASNYRTEFLDVYMGQRCSFLFGTPAGYDSIPALTFRKPILSTDCCPLFPILFSARSKMLYSLKHYYSIEKKKKLSIKEIFDLNISDVIGFELKKKNIQLIENSSLELKESIKEMINSFELNFKYSNEDLELREKFNKIISNCFVKYLSQNEKKLNNSELNTLISNKNLIKSKISISFLKKNTYLLR